MASISDKLDTVIKELNELIAGNGGTPIPYNGSMAIDDHVDHIAKLVDAISAGGGASSSVEVIKIWTGTITYAIDVFVNGFGGALVDNKTIGELIGDKKVISTFYTTSDSNIGEVLWSLMYKGTKINPIAGQGEEHYKDCDAVSSTNAVFRFNSTVASTITIDIYVVCI